MEQSTGSSGPLHSMAYTEMQRAECVCFEDAATGVRLKLKQGREMSVHEVVWQSAMLLSKYLCEHPEAVRGKRVAEVGSGIGLVGLVAAALGAKAVLLTDVTESVALIRENIEANSCSTGTTAVTAEVLHWGNETDLKGLRATADVVIAADCVYQQSSEDLKNLAFTIDHILHPDASGLPGSVLMAYEHRGDWVDNVVFFDEICHRGFKVDAQVSLEQYCPTPTDDLILYAFSKLAEDAKEEALEFECADVDGDCWRFRQDVSVGSVGEKKGKNACCGSSRVFAYLNDERRPAVQSLRVFSPTIVALDPPVPGAVRVAAFAESTLVDLVQFFSGCGVPTVRCRIPSVGSQVKLLVDHYHDEEPFGLLAQEGDLAVITDLSACCTQAALRMHDGEHSLDTFVDAIAEIPPRQQGQE